MSQSRTRVAVVVFADVDPVVEPAHYLVERLIRERLGEPDGTEHTVKLGDTGREFRIRLHDVLEAGAAAGNGYLWTRPTAKAFRQYDWQFEGEDES